MPEMKTTTKHTPGPWIAHYYNASMAIRTGWRIETSDRTQIAIIPDHTFVQPYEEANARILAAAPDLLAALTRLVVGHPGKAALLDYYHDRANCEAPTICEHCLSVEQARAAIKKAEGQ